MGNFVARILLVEECLWCKDLEVINIVHLGLATFDDSRSSSILKRLG